jgi:predicted HicB family RNase H-like nuclease
MSELEALIRKRQQIKNEIQRLEGRLEAAKQSKEEIYEECRKRGVDPENLDEIIEKLGVRYENLVRELAEETEQAARDLAQYQQDEV